MFIEYYVFLSYKMLVWQKKKLFELPTFTYLHTKMFLRNILNICLEGI